MEERLDADAVERERERLGAGTTVATERVIDVEQHGLDGRIRVGR
ncbi:MAG: hypothetical protein V5A62_16085 [Haloarculaceae archaeon]